jgi:acetyl-CoA carboxylase/biotin carboxylase 1
MSEQQHSPTGAAAVTTTTTIAQAANAATTTTVTLETETTTTTSASSEVITTETTIETTTSTTAEVVATAESTVAVTTKKMGVAEAATTAIDVPPRDRSESHPHHTFASVDEYVKETQGNRPIHSVLIANNGISAVKAIRSIRSWCYEMFADEHKITFVVMATPEDLRANAEYIRMAEHVVEVPGGANNNNYANVELIVEIAERYNVDAVWAGWGHASENPTLPDTLKRTERKIVFIGPPAKPMRALGDKIGSTIIAQSAKVPTISWNGDGLAVNYRETDGIPQDIYNAAMLRDGAHCLEECRRIGFPVMIKASEGGGGKGIRKVLEESQVQSAWEAVRGEIPGSPIFVMKLAPKSRHLEVQLLADAYGNAIALSGRDCSVQRRHQKIVEEGPVLAPSAEVWGQMMRAATRLAQEVEYVNAGTVEYLFSELPEDQGNAFFFLELNPRLQVEHPVTEMITNVNLPAAQLQVAMGIPLHFIPDVRRLYMKDAFGKTTIDFENEKQAPPNGHVIAARITAEDPNAGFQPTSGSIKELNFRSTPDVWGYFSVDSSGQVHEFADSQIGHLFSWSTSRDRARKNMILALKELSIRGDIHTTVEYIVNMMESDDFKYNRIHTAWLDERISRHTEVRLHGRPDPLMVVLVGAVCSAYQSSNNRLVEYVSQLERGQLPSSDLLSQVEPLELIYEGIKYNIKACRSGPIQFTLFLNESYVQVEIRTLSDGGFLVLLNGKSHVAYATKEAQGLRLVVDGNTCVFTKEYDPTRLVTNTAGKLARYLVDDGASLRKGMPFAEIEVMKMYMPLLTPEAGVIRLLKSEGAVLAPGDCIATMELDDPSCVKKSECYMGKLPVASPKASNGTGALHKLKRSLTVLKTVLDGYFVPEDLVEKAVTELFEALNNPLLPVEELKEAMSPLAGRIPLDVFARITDKIQSFRTQVSESTTTVTEFSVGDIIAILDEHKQSLPTERAASDFDASVSALRDISEKYKSGLQSGFEVALTELINQYFVIENVYARTHNIEDVILALRQQNSGDLGVVFNFARSHRALDTKNKVLLQLISHLAQGSAGAPRKSIKSASFMPLLERLANFKENQYSLVALEARQLLMDNKMPSHRERLGQVEAVVREIIADGQPASLSAKFANLLDQSQPLFDLLISLLDHEELQVRECALELYIRRVYRSYLIDSMETKNFGNIFAKKFEFTSPIYDALAVGVPPAESYDDLAGLLARNGSQPDLTVAEKVVNEDVNEEGEDTTRGSFNLEYEKISASHQRHGAIVKFADLEAVKTSFDDVVDMFPLAKKTLSSKKEPCVNVLHIILLDEKTEESVLLQSAETFLKSVEEVLRNHNIRRVTFAVRPQAGGVFSSSHPADMFLYPGIYTFPHRLNYSEDKIVRHIEAPLAYKLELRRLRNYNVAPLTSNNKNVHLYLAKTKESDSHMISDRFQRLFVRAVVRQIDRADDGARSQYDVYPGPERTLVEALNALELAMGTSAVKTGLVTKNNHVFLNILPEAVVDPQYLEGVIRILASRYSERLSQLRVSQVELKINARFTNEDNSIPVRLIASNPTGYVVRVEAYVETSGLDEPIFTSIGDEGHGEWDGKPITTPYPVLFPFDKKREMAKTMSNTVYVYDFLELIEFSLLRSWRKYVHERAVPGGVKISIPNVLLETRELILDDSGNAVKETSRPRGNNDIGMVAWLLTLYTPEYPQGREIVIIANDITFKAGSFGTREDRLFELASKFSREKGIPRFFFSANAGARIGMAEAIKSVYKVSWKDENDPVKGFEYLYLNPEDYKRLSAEGSVSAVLKTTASGEERFVLTDIIGLEEDLGVENLRGSGTIAGETSRAYQEVFTLTYACGRSVGIGAYLVRLGHRTVQNATHSPIILTGYQALNKLMGKDVYSSNDQLGGVKVMHTNGVTHVTAKNHLSGVSSIIEWLSFVPAVRRGPLPVRDVSGWEVIERPVEFHPEDKSTQYDPRLLLTGKVDEATGKWISGFTDRGSFRETLDGWAKSVVVGRARLGGIPCGVVVTEVRTSEKVVPADPAAPNTQENLIQQAGQVWFPDSAHKTATAIKDFKGEDLPLFIFANWRGFSGGQRDMFDEVLKFGAAIVDGLVNYEQPVFVYIPPFAELRGGAWAVVDPTINEGIMEMYADPAGRGGVLEPAGLIEIKYRKKQLLEAMHRLDDKIKTLDQRLAGLSAEEQKQPEGLQIARDIKSREDALLPIYVQVATEFADLHDTPGRMKAKNCIRDIVEWKNARTFFYWRLKRQLAEFQLRRELVKCSSSRISFAGAEQHLKTWFTESVNGGRVPRQLNVSVDELWSRSDKDVLLWLASDKEWIQTRVTGLSREFTANQVVQLGLKDPKAAVAGILELLHQLSDKDREDALSSLRRGSIFHRSTSGTKLNTSYN